MLIVIMVRNLCLFRIKICGTQSMSLEEISLKEKKSLQVTAPDTSRPEN